VPLHLPALLRALLRFAGLVVVLGGAGCAPDEPGVETAVDRETFIATWIDLRQAALASPTGEASAEDVEAILEEHATTAEALEEFARVRGEDAPYMRGVWEEVERRMRIEAGEMPADSGVAAGEGG
jgi:hypothetical protein